MGRIKRSGAGIVDAETSQRLVAIATDAVEARAKTCTAAIYGWTSSRPDPRNEFVGTGTLIHAEGRHLVLTCAHIASDLFAAHDGELVLGSGTGLRGVPLKEVSLFRHSQRDDLALIEIRRLPRVAGIVARERHEFSIEDDFRLVRAHRRMFALVGFPATMVDFSRASRRRLHALTYGTVDHPTKRPTKLRLFLKYRDSDEWSKRLPHPRGLSGGAVIAFDEPRPEQIWSYGKVIAVQSATERDTHRYLKATTLRRLRDWIGW